MQGLPAALETGSIAGVASFRGIDGIGNGVPSLAESEVQFL